MASMNATNQENARTAVMALLNFKYEHQITKFFELKLEKDVLSYMHNHLTLEIMALRRNRRLNPILLGGDNHKIRSKISDKEFKKKFKLLSLALKIIVSLM